MAPIADRPAAPLTSSPVLVLLTLDSGCLMSISLLNTASPSPFPMQRGRHRPNVAPQFTPCRNPPGAGPAFAGAAEPPVEKLAHLMVLDEPGKPSVPQWICLRLAHRPGMPPARRIGASLADRRALVVPTGSAVFRKPLQLAHAHGLMSQLMSHFPGFPATATDSNESGRLRR